MTKAGNLLRGSVHCILSGKAFFRIGDWCVCRVGGKEHALTLLTWFIDSELQHCPCV